MPRLDNMPYTTQYLSVSPYSDVTYIAFLVVLTLIFWYFGFYLKRDKRKKVDWLQAFSQLFDNGSLANTFLSRFAIIFFVSVDMVLAPIGWLPYLYAPIELIGYAVVILLKDVVREILIHREGVPRPKRSIR